MHRVRRAIPPTETEYELEFSHDGANPGLDRFHLHLRCVSAWEIRSACGDGGFIS